LFEQKSKKAKLIAGAAVFNQKPKRGVAYLKENNLIEGYEGDDIESTLALAKFLKTSARLDKKLLGEYISSPDNLDLLKAFIGLFDFRNKSMADAMRDLLEAFRLPGEAQPIARITEVFAEHFFSYQPTEIADQDATYVLAYSVIMLNTDQHNPQNRKRMTIEDYQRNLRGVNNGKDFAPEYLAAIHDSIRRREIIMPQEHVGQAGFDYAWKGLIQRSRSAGATISLDTPAFDRPMFDVAWRPIVTAIASAFTSSPQDEFVIQKAITGFRHCAALARQFDLPEVIDTIVLSLAYATGLLDETDDGYQSANHPVVKTDVGSVSVSPLSVRFGTSFRCQLATVVLFTIANGNGNSIRDGWIQVRSSCDIRVGC
jgi:brefeldin A-resistance guanine nucleotide exchange factor 1